MILITDNACDVTGVDDIVEERHAADDQPTVLALPATCRVACLVGIEGRRARLVGEF